MRSVRSRAPSSRGAATSAIPDDSREPIEGIFALRTLRLQPPLELGLFVGNLAA